ncbi:MAG TPA: hypothetical protein VM487_19350 [Phycisphaerae bacterium]|nr:hypothetical protein [Phycisphaerae bacterium]
MFNVFVCLVGVLRVPTHSVGIDDEFRASVKNTRFIAHYEDSPAGDDLAILSVLVYGKKPGSAQAERILRYNLKAALALYKDKDVLATAWHVKGHDERMILLEDGSNHLIYIAKEKKTKTWKEHEGTKTDVSTNKEKGYFVEYEERDILVAPRGRKSAKLNVVFQEQPSRGKAYSILVAELKKAVAKQKKKWRTTAYACVGKREDPASRNQIRDKERRDGGYIVVEYDPANGKITGADGKDLGRIKP